MLDWNEQNNEVPPNTCKLKSMSSLALVAKLERKVHDEGSN